MSGVRSSADEVAESSQASSKSLKRKRLSRSLTEPILNNAILDPSQTPSSTPKHRRTNATPTRTYTSKSRSFLVALPVSKLGSLGLSDADPNPLENEPTGDESQESYTDLRTRWGVDISEMDALDLSPSPSPSKRKSRVTTASVSPQDELPVLDLVTDLKTITELRDKGESRRFHDEVGYLFEGMDPKSNIGVRRAGYVSLWFSLKYALKLPCQCTRDCHQVVRP